MLKMSRPLCLPVMFTMLLELASLPFAGSSRAIASSSLVVKSQSASVLRRMDGISAAVDGSESGNGALMERVAGLEKVISALAERLPTAGDGSAERGASDEMPPSLINDIKVRFLGV